MTPRLRDSFSVFALVRFALLTGVALAAIGIAMVGQATYAFWDIDNRLVDLRFAIRGAEPTPSKLFVVGVDDATLRRYRPEWPLPRALNARVIDRLRRDGARAIAFNLHYDTSDDPRGERALVDATARAGNVVFAAQAVDKRRDPRTGSLVGIVPTALGVQHSLRAARAAAGYAILRPDDDHAVRTLPGVKSGLPNLAVVAAEVAMGHRLPPQRQDEWIDYRGPPGTIRSVSYADVADGKTPAGLFRDAVVVIGATSRRLLDMAKTPTSGSEPMSGPEVHANAIWSAERGFPLANTSRSFNFWLVVVCGLLPALASFRLSLGRSLALAGLAAVALVVASQLAFEGGWVMPVTYPLVALAGTSIGLVPVAFVSRTLNRARDLFSRFVPGEIVDQVLGSSGEPRVGGTRIEATVMFTDVRGFTSFSESLPAERVLAVLNRYLQAMSDEILANAGTLVSYMGDGIMAVFGAPAPHEDHADRALETARRMLSVRLPEFNRWLGSQGLGDGFRMGIGINSGPLVSGTVGSSQRLEYTALGDTTNTAARLEGMTKTTGHAVLLAESTRRALRRQPPDLHYVDRLELRGKRTPVEVWSFDSLASPDGRG